MSDCWRWLWVDAEASYDGNELRRDGLMRQCWDGQMT